jgi:hypothetical protein
LLETGRAGAPAQQTAAKAAAHEAQNGCGLTKNSALINKESNLNQNDGSGSGTVDKGGGGGDNLSRSAEDWWDSWAAPPAPPSAAAAEFGTFKATGGNGYGNFDELDKIMLMLLAPAPDQILMRCLIYGRVTTVTSTRFASYSPARWWRNSENEGHGCYDDKAGFLEFKS